MKRRVARLLALAFVLAVTGLVTSTHAADTKYYVAPARLNAAFQVMDRGYANIFGMFQSATGAFTFDPDTKTISNVKIAIDTGSMMVPNQMAGQELRGLFATNKYPEISFMATSPAVFKEGKAEIKGTLKIHGQSKATTFEGTLNNAGKNADGETAMGLSLRGSFKRDDFGMGDEPEIPGRFGDTITLLLEAQAIRQ